jgi:hypothetical protein
MIIISSFPSVRLQGSDRFVMIAVVCIFSSVRLIRDEAECKESG